MKHFAARGKGRDRGVGVELPFAIYNVEIFVEINVFLLIRLSYQLPRVLGVRHEVLVDIVGTVFGRHGGLCRGLSFKLILVLNLVQKCAIGSHL